jgi:hypothetical protein
MVVKRLSHKKILLKYDLPIYIGDELLVKIPIKMRYLNIGLNDEKYDYKMIGNLHRLYSIISQKIKIKKVLFGPIWENLVTIELDGEKYKVNFILESIIISDISTIREYKLKKILDNVVEVE